MSEYVQNRITDVLQDPERHPSTKSLIQFFTYDHLPEHLKPHSESIALVAIEAVDTIGDSPELTAGLRKLLEAKDCLVRAALTNHDKGKYSWTDR